MAERVLTVRELNRTLLARQLLLRRARLSVPRAIERVGALQAQWPPSPYVALWSRLEGFERDHLVRAVERRRVVKATLMRTTLHLVSAADYLAYAGLLLERRFEAVARQLAKLPGDIDIDGLAREIVLHTTERPRTRPELLELLGRPRLDISERQPWLVWHQLAAKAALVHGPSSSIWRKNTSGVTFVPGSAWLGSEGARGPYWGTFGHHEKYDDRMLIFADFLASGEHTYRYLVQATTPGQFSAPATLIEQSGAKSRQRRETT